MVPLPQVQFAATGPGAGQSVVTPAVDGGLLQPPAPQTVLAFVDAPALTSGQLPNGETVTYTLLEGNDRTFATVINSTVMGTQTGSGGVGASAATFAARPKFQGGSYLAMKITASTNANASGETLILSFGIVTVQGIHA